MLEELAADPLSCLFADLRADLKHVVDRPTNVVLGEADELLDTRMIHYLTGIPKLSLVAICHDIIEGGIAWMRPTAFALRASTRSAFETIYRKQAEIESEIGAELDWQGPTETSSSRQRSQITATREGNIIKHAEQWKEYQVWFIGINERFHEAFDP